MKPIEWDDTKNKTLKESRGISFEEIIFYIAHGFLLDIVPHHNQHKYSGQKMFIVDIDNYAYLVPFVETETTIFLKTAIPSRKATKKYLKR
jgi:uncharacterized DUF497 family protein